jgi:hypothetical protein
MCARSAGAVCLPHGAGPIGKDDARKVVLTFEGRNVDLKIESADGFIRLLHGETND